MSYVPNYLEYRPRQADGWPAFVTEAGKKYAEDAARECLRTFREQADRPWVTLDDIQQFIFHTADRPAEFKGVALWDARLAVAHRAALAAGLTQVWVGG